MGFLKAQSEMINTMIWRGKECDSKTKLAEKKVVGVEPGKNGSGVDEE